eukprot:1248048-Heterocapsa_arctica.AAC.1
MSDSGALAYNGTGAKSKGTTLQAMLCKGEQLAHPWSTAEMICGSGWTAKDWLVGIKAFIKENDKFKTPHGNGKYLFPVSMPCIVLDNLNACFDERSKKYCGLRADKEWLVIGVLLEHMLEFRSR